MHIPGKPGLITTDTCTNHWCH